MNIKKLIKNIIFIFAILVCFYFFIVYNLKIEKIEKTQTGELITISIFGNRNNYYFEY